MKLDIALSQNCLSWYSSRSGWVFSYCKLAYYLSYVFGKAHMRHNTFIFTKSLLHFVRWVTHLSVFRLSLCTGALAFKQPGRIDHKKGGAQRNVLILYFFLSSSRNGAGMILALRSSFMTRYCHCFCQFNVAFRLGLIALVGRWRWAKLNNAVVKCQSS